MAPFISKGVPDFSRKSHQIHSTTPLRSNEAGKKPEPALSIVWHHSGHPLVLLENHPPHLSTSRPFNGHRQTHPTIRLWPNEATGTKTSLVNCTRPFQTFTIPFRESSSSPCHLSPLQRQASTSILIFRQIFLFCGNYKA